MTDAEIEEMRAELEAFRKKDNVIHPNVEPAYFVGQWVTCADGDRHRVMGRAIDWDKNVTYTLGLPGEDEAWEAHHFEVAEADATSLMHKFALGESVSHGGTVYQIGAQHFSAGGDPYYELRDPEANGGRFAKHAEERDIAGL